MKTEIDLEELAKIPINIVVKDFVGRKDGCITYHEPHCPNYFLFEEESTPYVRMHVENVDKASSFTSRAENHSSQPVLGDADNQSQPSRGRRGRKTISNFPAQDASLFSAKPAGAHSKIVAKESTIWLNHLLAVFHEAWKDAKVFQRLVCESTYFALNVDRSASLGEIRAIGLRMEGQPPEIKWVRKSPNDNHADDGIKPHFAYDAEVVVPGKVKLLVSTEYKINWPAANWVVFPVKLEVIVSRISGKIRIQYSNDKSKGSFLQFLGRPAISVDVEPVMGEVSKINLKSIPTVKTLIKDIVNKAIEELCYPNLVRMEIPCVLES